MCYPPCYPSCYPCVTRVLPVLPVVLPVELAAPWGLPGRSGTDSDTDPKLTNKQFFDEHFFDEWKWWNMEVAVFGSKRFRSDALSRKSFKFQWNCMYFRSWPLDNFAPRRKVWRFNISFERLKAWLLTRLDCWRGLTADKAGRNKPANVTNSRVKTKAYPRCRISSGFIASVIKPVVRAQVVQYHCPRVRCCWQESLCPPRV